MGYIYDNLQKYVIYKELVRAECDQCKQDIPLDLMMGTPIDALPITLHGGYGYYFDCDENPHVLLCKRCAGDLLAAFPCMEDVIKVAL